MNEQELKINEEEIISLIQDLPAWKVKNIYLYGSRVYGNNKHDSDYDILVIANTMTPKEIRSFGARDYNIHIKTPDMFTDSLRQYKMVSLECMFAPEFAKIKEKEDYFSSFKINEVQLKRYVLSQSHDSWVKAKFKINDGDVIRGIKSLFHSLRMLVFAKQILESGLIEDFSGANEYWEDIENSKSVSWTDFKNEFLPLKKELENFITKI